MVFFVLKINEEKKRQKIITKSYTVHSGMWLPQTWGKVRKERQPSFAWWCVPITMASLCGGLGSLFLKYLNIVRFKLSFELPALVQPAQVISHGHVCSFNIIVFFLSERWHYNSFLAFTLSSDVIHLLFCPSICSCLHFLLHTESCHWMKHILRSHRSRSRKTD